MWSNLARHERIVIPILVVVVCFALLFKMVGIMHWPAFLIIIGVSTYFIVTALLRAGIDTADELTTAASVGAADARAEADALYARARAFFIAKSNP